ncbi:putative uncharacterized protein ZNRD1-AS1 [Choloepus didactylus]|uniref:putative uncharacterized protein ZNRD1-AS1 n=1 Tax=Choloepus didactylus TaxID=27675 RepID=UPI00189E70EE|nr:putative uncharacterized protein ZNRD1-AS1 [Choloepus didactylus]
MLYVLIEAERAQIQKLQKENEVIKLEPRNISEDEGSWGTEQSDTDVLRQYLTKKSVSSLSQYPIQDSEWFKLSPQEKLAWAIASKDSRIAAGQESPLEKKILNLGGVHTTAARRLIAQKYQEEYETLCREQSLSLDYWLAKAESYYNKRIVEMMKEQKSGSEIKEKIEEKKTQGIERQKLYYLVPERELKHIERHIHRTGQAREFMNKTFKQPRFPSEITLPKIVTEEHGIQKAQRRKQVTEREQMQIKDHQERMIRGRELIEQRLKERLLEKKQSLPSVRMKHEKVKKEEKELERVIAYPLFQPHHRSRIKVNILMEKPQNRDEEYTVIKPYPKKFLTMPPFLRSQIGKIKD